MTLRYRIAAPDPRNHLFEVHCSVADPAATGQRFRLPTWIPGSYLIREFARHIVTLRAESPAGPVALEKEAKDTWRAAPTTGPLTVIAEIYAYDLSVRAAYLDGSRGFFNGSSVFLCPEGREASPCLVEIVAPAGPDHARWRVATSLPSAGAPPHGFGLYAAENYDALIDHPVEMSDFTLGSFEAGGAVHEIAISGRHRADLPRLTADLARICEAQCRLFGDGAQARAPFDRYVFLVAAVGEGYGGLEHRASTSLLCRRDDLPVPGAKAVSDDYRSFLGLASHEYFHAWNVKRIKPAAFVPYDLGREAYTRQLWAFEGFTSYYDDLMLVRSGVIGLADYLELLGRTITSVLRGSGRHRQSVAESSFDAWIKYYRQDENTPNAVVSYYAKGALVALALDLTLRRSGSSLDVLLRALWQRYGRTGTGVPEDGIARLAGELAGTSLQDFFARFVDGTEDPPLADLLADAGIRYHVRASAKGSDRGGTSAPPREAPRASLGLKLGSGAEPRLQHVFRGGPAERAGLAANDVLVALDGLKASADALDRLLDRRRPGDAIDVHAFRRDELIRTTCVLDEAPQDTCWLEADAAADAATQARRIAWLGPGAGSAAAATPGPR